MKKPTCTNNKSKKRYEVTQTYLQLGHHIIADNGNFNETVENFCLLLH